MKSNSLPAAILALVLLVSCHSKKPTVTDYPVLRMKSTPVLDMGKYVESVRYIQLENHPESAFIEISRVLVSGERLFMLDTRMNAVFCFDTSGAFRYRIFRIGRGPGEYQELNSIFLDPVKGELGLHCYYPGKILYFSLDGKFLREHKNQPEVREMVRLGNGDLLGFCSWFGTVGEKEIRPGMHLYRPDGSHRGQIWTKNDSTTYWSVMHYRFIEESEGGAEILMQSDTVWKVDPQGNLKIGFCLDWGERTMPLENRRFYRYSPGKPDLMASTSIATVDQLISIGSLRFFQLYTDHHMEFAVGDLKTGDGIFSTQVNSTTHPVPLIYPIGKSDRNELIGIIDMNTLYALTEMEIKDPEGIGNTDLLNQLSRITEKAIREDRPLVWFAEIKNDYLTH